jgi:hypothetical protein
MENTQNELQNIKAIGCKLKSLTDNIDNFIVFLIFIGNLLQYDIQSLFSWAGTKIKMKEELNEIFEKLYYDKLNRTGTGYTIFVDTFGGALNSTLVLKSLLQLTDVKTFIANDIDKVVYHTHLHCKEEPNEMIKEFANIIITKFIDIYGTIFISKIKFQSVLKELVEEFNELQTTENYCIALSVRFIILRDFQFSGNLEYNKKTGLMRMSSKIYDTKKMYKWFFKQPIRIQRISKIYNELDIQFYNLDCFELLKLKEIKNNPNALINLDPPYVKQTNKTFTEEELEKMTDKEIEDCRVDYNQKFPHTELLKLLPTMNFIYNNNKHPIVDYYVKKMTAKSVIFDRKEKMTARKGKKVAIVKESIVYYNSLIK